MATIRGEIPRGLTQSIVQDTTNHSIFFLNKAPRQEKSASIDNNIDHQQFDDEHYLMRYPDVAAAVANGQFKSGWDHYDQYGRTEGRSAPVKT